MSAAYEEEVRISVRLTSDGTEWVVWVVQDDGQCSWWLDGSLRGLEFRTDVAKLDDAVRGAVRHALYNSSQAALVERSLKLYPTNGGT